MAYAGYGTTITDILNTWADYGVFAYILPFLIIFAFVYALLSKSKLLGENRGVHATLALAVGLISLQFDYVSNFFATIFPYAGIGISVLLVALILMGVLTEDEKASKWVFFGIGAVIFIVVMLYTIYDFQWMGRYVGIEWGPWIVLALIIGGVVTFMIVESKKTSTTSRTKTT